MNSAWKSIASVVPAPALALVSQWLGLFSNTLLVLPAWREEAQGLALAIGTVTIVLICLTCGDAPIPALRKRAIACFVLTLVLIALCLQIFHRLGGGMPTATVERWQTIWMFLYIGAMVAMVAAIAFGALSVREKSHSLVKVVIATLVVLVVVLAVVIVAMSLLQ